MQNKLFSRSKRRQNVISWTDFFFRIWHVEKFLFLDVTRCIFFNSKSDTLYDFYSKVWQEEKICLHNLTRCEVFDAKSDFLIVFQVFAEKWLILKKNVRSLLLVIEWYSVQRLCLLVFFVVGLMTSVMAISFALPPQIFKSLLLVKNGKLKTIWFRKLQIATITTITIKETFHSLCGNRWFPLDSLSF